MPTISPAKQEVIIKNGQVLIKECGILRHRIRKVPVKHLSPDKYYERRRQLRENRAEEIRRNEKLLAYINWICELQAKLGLSNTLFAKRLGVTAQTVKLWKRKSGHFPSKQAYLRLLELELEAKIPVIVLKIKYGVKM